MQDEQFEDDLPSPIMDNVDGTCDAYGLNIGIEDLFFKTADADSLSWPLTGAALNAPLQGSQTTALTDENFQDADENFQDGPDYLSGGVHESRIQEELSRYDPASTQINGYQITLEAGQSRPSLRRNELNLPQIVMDAEGGPMSVYEGPMSVLEGLVLVAEGPMYATSGGRSMNTSGGPEYRSIATPLCVEGRYVGRRPMTRIVTDSLNPPQPKRTRDPLRTFLPDTIHYNSRHDPDYINPLISLFMYACFPLIAILVCMFSSESPGVVPVLLFVSRATSIIYVWQMISLTDGCPTKIIKSGFAFLIYFTVSCLLSLWDDYSNINGNILEEI